MRNFLLTCLLFVASFAFAQAPTITGDILLCPYTNGTATITGSTTYTTYQWYYKYWFLDDEYEAIEGATSSSFTYDWYTYDQALLKVVVTQGAQTYESNSIQIDSYAWVGLTVMHSTNDNVSEDGNGGYLLCEGGAITNTIGSPYTSVQWFKDGVAIAGATSNVYVITTPGTYHAVAAPGFCPASTSNTLPITVALNPDCLPADNTPVIEGDTMLCEYTDGTAAIANGVIYDTYQWYVKFYGDEEYTLQEGETAASFTYDAYNYTLSSIKVVVTLDGETYESNVLFIDQYVWGSLSVMHEANDAVTFDPDQGYLLCEGGEIINTIDSPYTIVQWFKDGVAIEGATSPVFVITEPGIYHATAAPGFCPNSVSTTLPITVINNTNCSPQTGAPVIAGDVMLCPYTNGTAEITNGQTYETYQWYYKYWFTDDEFVAIEGATSATFTYDWFTYDQALLKVVVTQDGETYESNTIQIDSHNWASLTFGSEFSEGVVPDNETFSYLICPGDFITNTLNSPYDSSIQWYRDGEAIEGANEGTYVITEPGSYYVVAAPAVCPNATSSTLVSPLVVSWNPECTAGVNDPSAQDAFVIYPNPASSTLNLQLPQSSLLNEYTIFDVTGKNLMSGSVNTSASAINISGLAAGTYIIKLNGGQAQATKMFIKN
ncbi:T9SS type A sorting domain-containing protein [Flavobacterium zepuense]|nr:T9SS type A sorting domain-containing protein [Flavobacterium zepuense]